MKPEIDENTKPAPNALRRDQDNVFLGSLISALGRKVSGEGDVSKQAEDSFLLQYAVREGAFDD